MDEAVSDVADDGNVPVVAVAADADNVADCGADVDELAPVGTGTLAAVAAAAA